MGCCESANGSGSLKLFSEKIKLAIDSDSINRINMLTNVVKKKLSLKDSSFLDNEIYTANKVKLNPLGYALFLGKTQIFKFLLEKGASLKAMHELLEQSSIRAINVVCFKGYKDLLEFYLPLYLTDHSSLRLSVKSSTIDFQETKETGLEYDLAIHSACRAGMIHIVLFLYNSFKDKPHCPKEFDIHATDEYFGEDAALIACRVGSFPLIKLLHDTCTADFYHFNANKENALMICASGYKSSPSFNYIECIKYLVEIIKVDITYNYEELLYLVEGKEMIAYVEKQLESVGILIKKNDLDNCVPSFRVVHDKTDNSEAPIFTDEVREYLDGERSILSSIENFESIIDFDNPSILNNIS